VLYVLGERKPERERESSKGLASWFEIRPEKSNAVVVWRGGVP
jgi:hypothetical protein